MRGRIDGQAPLFHTFSVEDRIRPDHPLRDVKRRADRILDALSPKFTAAYAATGRPSVPPERLLKAQLLLALYSIRSERQLCERIDTDLLFRWFLDLQPGDDAFVPAVFSHNRKRLDDAALTRAFFDARGYTEVETPYAVPAPGEEVHLRAFRTVQENVDGSERPLWLHTSPEFAMKRLLVAGAGPVFQLARVWRDGEGSARHAAEFSMLEWYRPGFDFDGLIDETAALLRAVLPPVVTSGGVRTSLAAFERLTVAEAFFQYARADVLGTASDAQGLARSAGATLRTDESWEDLFFRLLLERVEPHLGQAHPTFLTHWPAAQAALARRDPADPRVALRFELFVCGMELANAFEELTDAAEQQARFVEDRAQRHALYGPDWPLDEAFLAALRHGMPPASGIALGFDRLAMLAAGADRIGQVLWLPD